MVCALGVICLSLAGCRTTGGYPGAFGFLAAGEGQVVAGSLDSVSASVQASLKGLGLAATVTQNAEAVRISSCTVTGKSFTVVLTRQKRDGREQTHVRIEWDSGSDSETHQKIMADVKVAK
jgi:hypothetical protein